MRMARFDNDVSHDGKRRQSYWGLQTILPDETHKEPDSNPMGDCSRPRLASRTSLDHAADPRAACNFPMSRRNAMMWFQLGMVGDARFVTRFPPKIASRSFEGA